MPSVCLCGRERELERERAKRRQHKICTTKLATCVLFVCSMASLIRAYSLAYYTVQISLNTNSVYRQNRYVNEMSMACQNERDEAKLVLWRQSHVSKAVYSRLLAIHVNIYLHKQIDIFALFYGFRQIKWKLLRNQMTTAPCLLNIVVDIINQFFRYEK